MKYVNYIIIKKVTLLSLLLLSFSNNYSAVPSASLKHMFVELNPTEKHLLTNYLKNVYLDIFYNEKKDEAYEVFNKTKEQADEKKAEAISGGILRLGNNLKDSRTALQKGSKKAFSLSLKILSNLESTSKAYELFFTELGITVPKP